MWIERFARGHGFTPEAMRVMNDALEVAAMALGIEPFEEGRRDTLAELIVELAMANPSLGASALSERAVKVLELDSAEASLSACPLIKLGGKFGVLQRALLRSFPSQWRDRG